jgi:ATP-dependent Lhr-like helicase
VRDPDELHDALLTLVWLSVEELKDWAMHLPRLIEEGRVAELAARGEGLEARGWVAEENKSKVGAVFATADEVGLDEIVQGWMESIGPTTVEALAARLHLSPSRLSNSLLRLEATGQVLRGCFRAAQARDERRGASGGEGISVPLPLATCPLPGANESAPEWCHRRLLARIHRLTIGTLRKEIEPVTAAEFMSFLLRWQHVAPGARLHGEAGLAEVIRQLAGFEAAASAWEPHLLRTRLAKYEPEHLDRLCLSGAVSWGRLSPHPRLAQGGDFERRRIVPTSVAPISVFPREASEWLMEAFQDDAVSAGSDPFVQLSSVAQDLRRTLQERGANFFADLVRMTNHLPTEVEEGLWELVAAGQVTADGFDNLRALMDPRRRRAEGRARSRRPRHSAGRWSLLTQPVSYQSSAISSERGVSGASPITHHASLLVDQVARQLLRRYGVVFRDLLARESLVQSWRDLLVQYRRMELQGEIREGRFVSGFVGEQFALPEAVQSMRALRKTGFGLTQEVKLSACDPLNLAGVSLPGPRIPAVPTNILVYQDGAIIRTVTGRGREDRPVGLAPVAR